MAESTRPDPELPAYHDTGEAARRMALILDADRAPYRGAHLPHLPSHEHAARSAPRAMPAATSRFLAERLGPGTDDPMQALSTYQQPGQLGHYMRMYSRLTIADTDNLFYLVAGSTTGYKTGDGAAEGFSPIRGGSWGNECESSSVQVAQVGDQVKPLRAMCPLEDDTEVWYHIMCFRKDNVVASVTGSTFLGGPSFDPLLFEQLTRLARIVEARIRPLRFGDE